LLDKELNFCNGKIDVLKVEKKRLKNKCESLQEELNKNLQSNNFRRKSITKMHEAQEVAKMQAQ